MSIFTKLRNWLTEYFGLVFFIIGVGICLWQFTGIAITLLVLTTCVVVHEYGHFVMMRRNGVKVLEFSVGFGPDVWQHECRSGLVVSVRLIPFGGYVKPLEQGEGSLPQASRRARFKIFMAGMFFNTLLATAAFMVLMWFFDYGLDVNRFPIIGWLPFWLRPLIVAPLVCFFLWLATPALLIYIPIVMGMTALVGGMAGPVGIAQAGAGMAAVADPLVIVERIIYMLWLINLGLAGFNLLPLTPLDGGYLPLLGIEKYYHWRAQRLYVRASHGMIHGPTVRQQLIVAKYEDDLKRMLARRDNVVKWFSRITMALIIMLIVAIFLGDFWRLFFGSPIKLFF